MIGEDEAALWRQAEGSAGALDVYLDPLVPPRSNMRRAVILGGGSFAASAWESGLLAGMASAGVDLRDADLFIGTSAGARVALHLAIGTDLGELYEQQFKSISNLRSPQSPPDWTTTRRDSAEARAAGGSLDTILRRFGKIALAHASLAPADLHARRDTMAAQLPVRTWPTKQLSIVAVNAETGERRAFDRATGVDLIDAMVATTASFTAIPALIDGHHYIDGGYHSSNNADLAIGFDEVIVLSLRAPSWALALVPTGRQRLGARSVRCTRHRHSARRGFRGRRDRGKPGKSGRPRADGEGSVRTGNACCIAYPASRRARCAVSAANA